MYCYWWVDELGQIIIRCFVFFLIFVGCVYSVIISWLNSDVSEKLLKWGNYSDSENIVKQHSKAYYVFLDVRRELSLYMTREHLPTEKQLLSIFSKVYSLRMRSHPTISSLLFFCRCLPQVVIFDQFTASFVFLSTLYFIISNTKYFSFSTHILALLRKEDNDERPKMVELRLFLSGSDISFGHQKRDHFVYFQNVIPAQNVLRIRDFAISQHGFLYTWQFSMKLLQIM